MYESFFHLRENPFALTADPRFLYRSRQHRAALLYLAQGVFGSKGFLALTGEVGTGKTTVVRTFLETFQPSVRVAFISNPKLDYEDLLYMLLTDFGCTVKDKSKRRRIFPPIWIPWRSCAWCPIWSRGATSSFKWSSSASPSWITCSNATSSGSSNRGYPVFTACSI
jgi:hypothetical protein